jgi:hypothetical protein
MKHAHLLNSLLFGLNVPANIEGKICTRKKQKMDDQNSLLKQYDEGGYQKLLPG